MKTEVRSIQGLRCVVGFPEGYRSGEAYPTILFLHGAGSRGTDLEVLRGNPYFQILSQKEEFPFVSIAPQCHENTWFDLIDALKRLVAEAVSYDFVDAERLYLMGASMGGYATWQLAMSVPWRFAAIVPICGGGMYWNAARLAHVPIWAFHGALDQTVLPEESQKMVDAVNRRGGDAKLTIYPNNGHDAWSDTYGDPAVFRWLLQHRSNATSEETEDGYRGSSVYG